MRSSTPSSTARWKFGLSPSASASLVAAMAAAYRADTTDRPGTCGFRAGAVDSASSADQVVPAAVLLLVAEVRSYTVTPPTVCAVKFDSTQFAISAALELEPPVEPEMK